MKPGKTQVFWLIPIINFVHHNSCFNGKYVGEINLNISFHNKLKFKNNNLRSVNNIFLIRFFQYFFCQLKLNISYKIANRFHRIGVRDLHNHMI